MKSVRRASSVGSEARADALADEMARAWRDGGSRPIAEEVLARVPDLAEDRDAILRLVFEEVCLREEAGEAIEPESIAARFPLWREDIGRLLDAHGLLATSSRPRLPEVGEVLGDFRLLSELGRGALGRVFLAAQGSLADRPVVLKVAPASGEHLTLAQLQHTYIVPLNGVQEFPGSGLLALCMPFVGGGTLATLLEELREIDSSKRRGRDLIAALDRVTAGSPVLFPSRGPFRQYLETATFARAMALIGACLADALHYAHDRGLLHLDVKPSNVLIAADGQPLLLDFHLARAPIFPDGEPPRWVGGTPGSMSPEQAAALTAVAMKRPIEVEVDARSDVYSLGLLLFEALGGRVESGRPTRLARSNPQVSPGLESILRKCLAPSPRDRYGDAAQLAADLRRHLADQPLRGVHDRHPWERWRKLRARRPHAPALVAMLAMVLLAAALVGAGSASHVFHRLKAAGAALADARDLTRAHRHAEATRLLARGIAQAEGQPGGTALRADLAQAVVQARRTALADEIRMVVDRGRFLAGSEGEASDAMRTIADQARTLWERRDEVLSRRGADLGPDEERQLLAGLAELVAIAGDFRVRLAPEDRREGARREALTRIDAAEAALPASLVLSLERRRHSEALGLDYEARAAGRAALAIEPTTVEELEALGVAEVRSGELEQAAEHFRRALVLRPQSFWANFHEGVLAFQADRLPEAEVAFRVSEALAPDSAFCAYNLARTLQASDRPTEAMTRYDRALKLDPRLAPALLNRGVLHFQLGHAEPAIADLRRARELGADPELVQAHLDRIHGGPGSVPASDQR